MKKIISAAIIVSAVLFLSCIKSQVQKNPEYIKQARTSLAQGDLVKLRQVTASQLNSSPDDPYAHLISAIEKYITLTLDLSRFFQREISSTRMRNISPSLSKFYQRLKFIDNSLQKIKAELKLASGYEDLKLSLTPADWVFDWNQDGYLSGSDRRFMQVEYDSSNNSIPSDSPEAKPEISFDHGDVVWAIAHISFQRAAVRLLMSLNIEDIDYILNNISEDLTVLKIRINKSDISVARTCIMEGLKYSGKARMIYLSEDDDDNEWIPNPRQKNHSLPLPIDETLYKNWGLIVADLQKLFKGKEALSTAELAEFLPIRLESKPEGFIDIGGILKNPGDIYLNIQLISMAMDYKNIEESLRLIYGKFYKKDARKSSLPSRLIRMKHEINIGQDFLENKLKYLLWIN